jgi:hypothetical protein
MAKTTTHLLSFVGSYFSSFSFSAARHFFAPFGHKSLQFTVNSTWLYLTL